jgi:hypothetical protein
MPTVSKKQQKFMAAVANNPKFAKKVGVPKSVGEEFMKADKTKKMAKGGMHEDVKMDKKVVKKAVGMHEKQLHGGKKSDLTKLRSGGACGMKKMAKGGLAAGHKAADGIAKKGKTKGMEVKMAKGGMAKKKYC